MSNDRHDGRLDIQQFQFEETSRSSATTGLDGQQSTTTDKGRKVSFDREDVIAWVAGVVALITVVAMIFHVFPLNALTVGMAGFSGAGAAIAAILAARKKGPAGG
jgi:hypothetical protein